jgi:class 3 adenylate cyclase
MAEERTQRGLAAIMVADVVGYSRLIEFDEARALAALKIAIEAFLRLWWLKITGMSSR